MPIIPDSEDEGLSREKDFSDLAYWKTHSNLYPDLSVQHQGIRVNEKPFVSDIGPKPQKKNLVRDFNANPKVQEAAETLFNYKATNSNWWERVIDTGLWLEGKEETPFDSLGILAYPVKTGASLSNVLFDPKKAYANLKPSDAMRDEVSRLESALSNYLILEEDAPEEVKQAYNYLRTEWDENTELDGWSDIMSAAAEHGINIATSPTTLASLALAKFTGGSSTALTQGAAATLKGNILKNMALMAASKTPAGIGTRTFTAGAVIGSADDALRQSVEETTGLINEFSLGRNASVAAMSGLLSGGLGFGISKFAMNRFNRTVNTSPTETNKSPYLLTDETVDYQLKDIEGAVDTNKISNIIEGEYRTVKESGDVIYVNRLGRGSTEEPVPIRQLDIDEIPLSPTKSRKAYTKRQASNAIERSKSNRRDASLYTALPDSEVNEILNTYQINNEILQNILKKFEERAERVNAIKATGPTQEAPYARNQRVRDFMLRNFKQVNDNKAMLKIATETNTPLPVVKGIASKVDNSFSRNTLTPDDEVSIQKMADKISEEIGGGEETAGKLYTSFADTINQGKILQRSDDDIFSDLNYGAKVEASKLYTNPAFSEFTQSKGFDKLRKWTQPFLGWKPASVLNKYKGFSPKAGELQRSFRHDLNQKWFERETEYSEWDFGEVFNATRGDYNFEFQQALQPLRSSMLGGKLQDDMEMEILEAVRGIPSKNKMINEAAAKIKTNFRRIGEDLVQSKAIDEEHLKNNYVPRIWDRKKIEADEEGFAQALVTGNQYPDLASARIGVTDILAKKQNHELLADTSGQYFILAGRKFNEIDDSKFTDFLNNDLDEIFAIYTTQAAKNVAKQKVWKVTNAGDFEDKWVIPIITELKNNPNFKGDTNKAEDTLRDLYKHATGEGIERYGHAADTIIDWYTTLNSTAYLAGAAFTNITEPLINIHRVGLGRTAEGLLKSIKDSSRTVVFHGANAMKREHNLTKPEVWNHLNKAHMAMKQSLVSTVERLVGSETFGKLPRKIQNFTFKYNGMHGLNHFTQLTAWHIGRGLITESLETLARHGSKTTSKDSSKARDLLMGLNVDIKKGLDWYKNGMKSNDPFNKTIEMGTARYVRHVYVEPTPETGTKTHFLSNPRTSWIMQLASFPQSFSNTVLKDVARGISKDPSKVGYTTSAVIASVLLAENADFLRSGGETRRSLPTDERLWKAFLRTGGAGNIVDMAERGLQQTRFNRSPLSFIAGMTGPVGSDVMSSLTKGPFQVMGGKTPGITLAPFVFGKEATDEYRKVFKDMDKAISLQGSPPPKRITYRKGGEVDIPRAPKEPDERRDKMTGLPYDEQAGEAFEDQEDRQRYNIGGAVGSALSKGIASTILKYSKRPIQRSEAEEAAQKIENKLFVNIAVKDPDVPIDPELEDSEGVLYLTRALLDEKHDLSLDELKERYPTHFNKEGILVGGEDFSKARGYTDEEIEAFARSSADPEIAHIISTELDDIDALDAPSWKRKLIDFNLQRVLPTLNWREISSSEKAAIRYDFLREMQTLDKEESDILYRIGSNMPDVPKRSLDDINREASKIKNPAERKRALKDFLKNSKEKKEMYRSTYSGFDLDQEVNFAWPREIGTHVGTRDQAEDILNNVNSRNDVAPRAITKGFIRVQNPLKLNEDFGDWGAESILLDTRNTQTLLDAINDQSEFPITTEQNNIFNDLLRDSLRAIPKAKRLGPSVFNADLNIRLRRFLESLGFDSIKYLNKIEGQKEKSSYILFRPNQFKSTWAEEFDPSSPRQNKRSGGLVLNSLKRRRA